MMHTAIRKGKEERDRERERERESITSSLQKVKS
jgi:hypothetical protein